MKSCTTIKSFALWKHRKLGKLITALAKISSSFQMLSFVFFVFFHREKLFWENKDQNNQILKIVETTVLTTAFF